MRRKQFLACLLAGVTALSVTACGQTSTSSSSTSEADTTAAITEDTTTEAATEEPTTEEVTEAPTTEAVVPSVDFEDGNYAFVAIGNPSKKAIEGTVELADYNGSKAVKVTPSGEGQLFIGINVDGLLGDKVADCVKITMDLGQEHSDGNFYAISGDFRAYTGDDASSLKESSLNEWSVYLETKNPYTVTVKLGDASFTNGCDNYIIVHTNSDNDVAVSDAGLEPAVLYIDNICFYDADGNVLEADTSCEMGTPSGFTR